MLSKTVALEKCLLQEINSGRYRPGELIPSRNILVQRYNCSRTTVERAIASLEAAGLLVCRKGSGTYVAPNARHRKIDRVNVVICEELNKPLEIIFDEDLLDVPVKWFFGKKAPIEIEELATPGSAVIWARPNLELLSEIDYLALKGVPQLLLNRNYRHYDCIYTAAESSIRPGLEWLSQQCNGEISLICREPQIKFPYLPERLIATYELCLEMGIKLRHEQIFKFEPPLNRQTLAEIGEQIFQTARKPLGIFLLDQCEAVPLLTYAQRQNFVPGRDFFLLLFDTINELENCPGVAMIRQPLDRFVGEIRRWLKDGYASNPQRSFRIALDGELLQGM